MVMTVFIGQSFLSQPQGISGVDYYTFYGANSITRTLWQANFSKERVCDSSGYANNSTPFCLNLEEGSLLRIHGFFIYVQKDGSVGVCSDYIMDSYRGRCLVKSIKIVGIGQDFLTVEYELAK